MQTPYKCINYECHGPWPTVVLTFLLKRMANHLKIKIIHSYHIQITNHFSSITVYVKIPKSIPSITAVHYSIINRYIFRNIANIITSVSLNEK